MTPERVDAIGDAQEAVAPGIGPTDAITLGLVMPDFELRMATLARNVENSA